MASAEGMLEVMKENGLSPTVTSYSALLCGYADQGDMDRIEKVKNFTSPLSTSLSLSLSLHSCWRR